VTDPRATGRAPRLPRSFFARGPCAVARALLGRELVHETARGTVSGRIVEVEAYGGESDPASHARPGPTRRNASMYGPPGHAYVYRSHGIHLCFNVVTGRAGSASAVLVRALEPTRGLATMARWRGVGDPRRWTPGPGCVGEALGLERRHDGHDLTGETLWIGRRRVRHPGERIVATPRIGIRVGREWLWRFVLEHPGGDRGAAVRLPRVGR